MNGPRRTRKSGPLPPLPGDLRADSVLKPQEIPGSNNE
jgi:hypothetical protein